VLWQKNEIRGLYEKTFQNEAGQGLVEYGLIVASIAVAVIIALTSFSNGINGVYNTRYLSDPSLDPIMRSFINALKTSSIDYDDFLTKNKNFNIGSSTKYNPDTWNGYLEKLRNR